jgi:hypothetical protein
VGVLRRRGQGEGRRWLAVVGWLVITDVLETCGVGSMAHHTGSVVDISASEEHPPLTCCTRAPSVRKGSPYSLDIKSIYTAQYNTRLAAPFNYELVLYTPFVRVACDGLASWIRLQEEHSL